MSDAYNRYLRAEEKAVRPPAGGARPVADGRGAGHRARPGASPAADFIKGRKIRPRISLHNLVTFYARAASLTKRRRNLLPIIYTVAF